MQHKRCTAIFVGKWCRQIGPGEKEMMRVIMASVGVLGFISLSPTYQNAPRNLLEDD